MYFGTAIAYFGDFLVFLSAERGLGVSVIILVGEDVCKAFTLLV